MKPELFREADKIWKKLTYGASPQTHQFELDVYRRLLSFFMPGDYYYYIFNVKDVVFDMVSGEIEKVLGYDINLIDVPFFVDKIHPEDQSWFLNFEHKVSEFFRTLTEEQIPNYKVRYDYRVRKKNGDYIRVLQQVVTIQCDNGAILRTFGVHTDITHLKPYGKPVLSFIGLNGEPSYVDVEVKSRFRAKASSLTKRETEILRMLTEGRNSEEISKACFISIQTVNTHRKNLLQKTGCTNATELATLAIRNGWI